MPILVRDVMSTRLVTLSADETVSLAEQLMAAIHVRHLPVLGPGDRLVGLVSDRDLLAAAASSIAKLDVEDARAFTRTINIDEIMSREIHVVEPTTPLLDAARIMRAQKIGCLPVVDDDALVGLLTETDLVETLIRALQPNPPSSDAPPQDGG
jgi:acetoin utilization protein AcuB